MSHNLKLLSYLVPDFPLELYQTYQSLFEKVLSVQSLLCIENRPKELWNDLDGGVIDIAFLSSTNYVDLMKKDENHYKLLAVAPTFDLGDGKVQMQSHSEVIIAKDKSNEFKTFADLQGHRWAVTDSECIFGYSGVLGELKRMGHNAHFFGNFIHTRFQRDVIQSVLDRSADAGAVESFVLEMWRKENPDKADDIDVISSWGPYAPDPIVVSKRLPEETCTKLTRALVGLSKDHSEFVEPFRKFGITGFQEFNSELYWLTSELLELAKEEQLYPVYY